MPALTDAEILAALPAESRHKIDNAFEALSQSLPSDKERNILYRVAFTLKLNPTDTHFSVMASLHYYLQLYQEIPRKIENASAERLKEFSVLLKNTATHEMSMARDSVIGELSKQVGDIAQQIAGDAAAAENAAAISRATIWATASVLVCAIFFGGTGYLLRMASDKVNITTATEMVADANARTNAAEAAANATAAAAISETEKHTSEEVLAARKNAGWAATEEGKLAKKFFDSGAGVTAMKCKGEKWEIKTDKVGQDWCIPKRRPLLGWNNEQEYGWKIP